MGAADVVPGVSGGTVALILGHYRRLVTAISQFDRRAIEKASQRQWTGLWSHLDGRFLLPLGIGIGVGILGLGPLMHWLLEHRFSETMAVFFGLVLASGLIVGGMVKQWTPGRMVATVAAAGFAWLIASLTPVAGEPSTLFLFFAGAIAICAMILPGISGAFVLLLLGAYHPVTGMLKQIVSFDLSGSLLLRLTTFAVGCLFGLLAFSRLLSLLLARYSEITFAALLGLMLGSLRKLWPLQSATAETAELEFKEQVYTMVSWGDWKGPTWSLLGLILAAAGLVLVVHYAQHQSFAKATARLPDNTAAGVDGKANAGDADETGE